MKIDNKLVKNIIGNKNKKQKKYSKCKESKVKQNIERKRKKII